MRFWIRSIGAVVAGIVSALIIVAIAEIVNSRIYPLPPGVDLINADAVRNAVANFPNSAFILVLLGWAIGTLVGAWLASRLTRRAVHGAVVGGLLLIAGVLNMFSLPHPGWVWAVGLAAFPAGSFAGIRLATAKL